MIDKHTEIVSFSEYIVYPSFVSSLSSFRYNNMFSDTNRSDSDNDSEGRRVDELDEEKEEAVLLNRFSIDQMAVGENADCSPAVSQK